MLAPNDETLQADWFSKPADSIIGLIKRRDVSIHTVADAIDGGLDTVRGLFAGTRQIDNDIADTLSRTVGGSPAFWIKRQAKYESALEIAVKGSIDEIDQWLELVPPPGPRPRGRLSESQKKEELRKRLSFYGVNNLQAWLSRYAQIQKDTNFRTSASLSSTEGATALWLRQGELEAVLSSTCSWSPKKLRSILPEIVTLSKVRQPSRFIPKLKELGAKAGVAIVVVRYPKGCRASGASRMVTPDKAMVLLSFRHLSDDHFWFTTFHEFGHLLLHGANDFVDVDDMPLDDREREANQFASSCIIPPARWEDFENLKLNTKAIIRFSVSLGVSPGLIVGQLQHRKVISRDQYNFLKRRWTWAEVEASID